MDRSLVLLDIVDNTAVLTLNHVEKRNALSRAMLEALKDHLAAIAENQQVKIVVLRAAGPVFSSGHDLRELAGASKEEQAELFSLCTEVMESIRLLPQPVIAEVQGLATAAGCQLVATCDLVVASENAAFATPGVKIGLFCTTPAVALARAIAPKKAMEMLLTGSPISAEEACKLGLVNRVVAASRLSEEAIRLAGEIASASPAVVALGKRAYYRQLPLDYAEAYALSEKTMANNALMEDAQEGMKAFLEKRKPSWQSEQSLSKLKQ